jgi:hypothetical protein
MSTLSTANTYSYEAYREKVSKDLHDKLQNLPEDHLIQYIQLNETRMNRLDKTINLTDEVSLKLQQLKQKYTFYVISEGWCGDAAQILPVINKIASFTSLIDLKIIFRDENIDIMNQYLTNGTQSIPILVIFDANDNQIAVWGPRPKDAAAIIIEDKLKNGKVTDEGKTALQLWYTKDKGITIQNEIIALL